MALNYNIDFEIAGTIFLLVGLFFMYLQPFNQKHNTHLFVLFYMAVFMGQIFDIVSAITISYAQIIPYWMNMLINTAYFSFSALSEYLFLKYVMSYVSNEKAKIFVVFQQISFIFYFSLLFVNLFTGFMFDFRSGVYTHGILYLICYLIPFAYIFIAMVFVLIYRKDYENNVVRRIIVFDGIAILMMMIQLFYFQDILLSYFGVSLAALLMTFALETPNYIKLTEATIQLENANTELENLRENLEKEVNVQTTAVVERQQQLEHMSIQMVQTLAHAIDAKDEYTNGHSTRVAEYAVLLAKKLGWREKEIENLRYAAVLHDIGKIGVPDSILNKPTSLSDVEYEIIKTHTTVGYEIMKNITTIVDADLVARHHHERYDGRGYPDGLKGDEIPYIARLVGIADAFDAMSSRRVYRKALPKEKIRQELVNGRGTQFDPDMLDVFLEMFDSHELDAIANSYTVNDILINRYQGASEYDSLTGILNKDSGIQMIQDAMKEDTGYLAFIDVDNLSKLNHEQGNKVGDEILKRLGNILKDHNRNEITCRLGGDEFLLFMKGLDYEQTKKRIQEIIRLFSLETDEVTLSIGVNQCSLNDSYEKAFNKADKALFYVKNNGKKGYYFFSNTKFIYNRSSGQDLIELVNNIKEEKFSNEGIIPRYQELLKNINDASITDYTLVMITLEEALNVRMYVDEIEEAMKCMEQTIHSVIRSIDYCTHYSAIQFLVILVETKESDVESIIERIFNSFFKAYGKNDIQPSYSFVTTKQGEINEGSKV